MTGNLRGVLALVIAANLGTAAHARADQPAPPAVWDLKPLYADDAAYEAARESTEAALPGLKALAGSIKDASSLERVITRMSAVDKTVKRLIAYASLAADVDTRDSANQARRQLAMQLVSHAEEATSWLAPAVQSLGRARVEGFIAEQPGLAKFRYALESMLRLADHTLAPDGEALLAAAGDPLSQPGSIYEILSNADLPWPTIEIRGAKVRLDPETYVAHRSDADPAVRRQVFDAFFGAIKTFERTFGATYAADVKATEFIAKARKYPDAVTYALSGPNTPEAVYRTLIAETNKGLPTLHRYLADAKKLLGVSELRYSDLYVPLAKEPRRYTLGEAEQLTLEAVKPLGEQYHKDLANGFASGWMHALPQEGKRAGAYMNGIAYDVHPYVLLSFNGGYLSVSTVAHEWGHAMHSVLANRAQPFETADYKIFVAEIPSTTNEMLLADHVVAGAQTRAERIFALSQALELLRTTFFRQAMFAEFEAASHDMVEHGQALTGEALTKTYLGLLKRYMGDAEGVVKVDDLYGIEWAYIPHFYDDFYVFQYATSISAAAYFATGIEAGDTALRDRFLDMLKQGGSDDPYLVVKRAGPDLATPAPYEALFKRMNGLLDRLEQEMAAAP